MRFSRFSADCITAILIGSVIAVGQEQAMAVVKAIGTDVSNYQGGGINWASVKSDGVTFAWAKATEGVSFIDADFTINEANAKAAGVPIGAYDFAHPEDNTPAAESLYFWNEIKNYVKNDGLTIMPMLDYETFTGTIVGASTYSQWANLWCSDVVAYAASNGVKVTPVIYIGPCNTESYLNNTVKQWLNNIAVYPGNPQTGNPWTSSSCTSDPAWSGAWNIWQYGDTNWSGGDSDVFNGTASQMVAALVAGGATAPAGVTLYWDPGASPASPGSGGTGSWDASTSDWWYSGSSNVAWSSGGDNPVFAGTSGTVTLNAALSAGSVTFNTNGYVISGAANTLTLTNPATISVPPPGTSPVYMECLLAGSTGYTVTGGGVLVVNNTGNTISGTVTVVSNSTLVITASRALAERAGTVVLGSGGILQNNDQTNGDAFAPSAYSITLGTNGGVLNDNTSASLTYSGIISGSGGLTKTGSGGILILNAANTYTGNTTISAGTLALGSAGTINDTPTITIAAGATFDVSAIPSWTLSANTILQASGTGATVGTTAATIKGASASGVSFGTQPITLIYTPTATNGDTTHPSLYVSQGTLTLDSANTFTISNASGTAMGVGLYTLIQQASGSISGLPYTNTVAYQGAGVVSGTKSSLSVSGSAMNLTVARITATTLNALSASTYGQTVTFTATVAPSPSGGTVQFYDNGVALGSPVPVSGGTASYMTSTLAVGSHPITAKFSGTALYLTSATSSASTQQVNSASLSVTASPQSKMYGTFLIFGSGSTNFTSSGLQNGETVGSVTLAVSGNGGATNAPVGSYTITPSAATGGSGTEGDYNITYNTNTLTVTLPSNTIPVTIVGVSLLSDGTVQLNFSGTPGYVYLIEAATNLNPPITWTPISTNAADTNGNFSFIDVNATNYSGRYYQTSIQ